MRLLLPYGPCVYAPFLPSTFLPIYFFFHALYELEKAGDEAVKRGKGRLKHCYANHHYQKNVKKDKQPVGQIASLKYYTPKD